MNRGEELNLGYGFHLLLRGEFAYGDRLYDIQLVVLVTAGTIDGTKGATAEFALVVAVGVVKGRLVRGKEGIR